MRRVLLGVAAATVVATLAGGAAAQTRTETLRAEQAAIYAQLLAAPDDPALMRAYAQVSLELDDVEAAISTLERALLYDPGNAQLQLELGAAYYRIGSYAAAQSYFEGARAAGLDAVADARVDEFLAAIAARSARSRFGGYAMVGGTYSTNANLGPDDRNIRVGGFDGVLPIDGLTEEPDFGVRALGYLRHDYDLGRPNLDTWRTDVGFYAIRFFDENDGDIETLSVKTGPSLSLDESAFGPKARPFVRFQGVRQDDHWFYYEVSGGVEAANTLSAAWSIFGEISLNQRNHRSESDAFDAFIARGFGGVAWTPRRDTTVVGVLLAESQDADSDPQSSVEFGARVAAAYDYNPKIREAGGPWTLSGFAQYTRRDFDQPDPVVDSNTTREDDNVRFGVSNRFRFHGGYGLQVELDGVKRTSNLPNFDFDSINASISLVYEF